MSVWLHLCEDLKPYLVRISIRSSRTGEGERGFRGGGGVRARGSGGGSGARSKPTIFLAKQWSIPDAIYRGLCDDDV